MNPLSMTGGGPSGAGGLGRISGQAASGWQNVAASSFAMSQGTAQNAALSKAEKESLMKQSLITLVTSIVEGACKMVKGAGEGIKGLC
ncbi:MAG TPA: hypothetical protein VF169_01210 [Albitalea sp.]|uniref:hypothetical protein n=1 Tax=Piscinibacter sp. TaxID=1903157 RepID=UPI002ED00B67